MMKVEEYLGSIKSMSAYTIRDKEYTLKRALKFTTPKGFLDTAPTNTTFNKWLSILHAYYRWEVENGFTTANPVNLSWRHRLPTPTPKYLMPHQINTLIDDITGVGLNDVRDRAIIEVGVSISARVGDLSSILISNINMDTCQVKIIGKGNREFVQPLGRQAMTALKAYLTIRKSDSDILFVDTRGRPLKHIAHIMRKRLGGLIRPHALMRHSVAIAMLRNGAPINVVQRALRHSNISTTSRYVAIHDQELIHAHQTTHPRG